MSKPESGDWLYDGEKWGVIVTVVPENGRTDVIVNGEVVWSQ